MPVKIQTVLGHAMPPAPRHAITTHMPTWRILQQFRDQDPEIIKVFRSMYPRFWIHPDIIQLATKLKELAHETDKACFIFLSLQAATDAVAFSTSPRRGENTIPADQISIRAFKTDLPLFVVFFPPACQKVVHSFWLHAGVGISSRRAEETLKQVATLVEVPVEEAAMIKPKDSPAHITLRQRIADQLNRAPADPKRVTTAKADDIYLFQTGMAGIFWVHQYLLSKYASTSVLFGFAFHSTIHVLEDIGPGYELLGLGTDEDIDRLEKHLATLSQQGKTPQAIWAEFPTNPLLITPDLGRLRALADQYGTLLILDETISSFCNVDVLGVADILVSSLTKSFSGYADLMAGCATLNPTAKRYPELKELFSQQYQNSFFAGDAEALERNSRNYLSRSAILNNNAQRLADHLQVKALDPTSRVTKVYYPSLLPSLDHYKRFMRQPTADFTPGYGSMFSVEFDTVEAAATFYDNLHVHQGPHFGAPLTLALGYTMGVYGTDLAAVEKYGLREPQIRIGVGLEDTEELLNVVEYAVAAADSLPRN